MNSGEKIEETIVVYQISQLSEALLIHIFSLMPTAQTLRTSGLSKRWCYLWNLLDTFSFSTSSYHERYISYVLGHFVSPKI